MHFSHFGEADRGYARVSATSALAKYVGLDHRPSHWCGTFDRLSNAVQADAGSVQLGQGVATRRTLRPRRPTKQIMRTSKWRGTGIVPLMSGGQHRSEGSRAAPIMLWVGCMSPGAGL